MTEEIDGLNAWINKIYEAAADSPPPVFLVSETLYRSLPNTPEPKPEPVPNDILDAVLPEWLEVNGWEVFQPDVYGWSAQRRHESGDITIYYNEGGAKPFYIEMDVASFIMDSLNEYTKSLETAVKLKEYLDEAVAHAATLGVKIEW